MPPTTLAHARADALRADPGVPFITDRTQGRVELSRATFDNWVTKTVNFLRLEAGVEPGATVGVRLPLHWMAAVWCVAVWEAGADLAPGAPGDVSVGLADTDVVVVADALGMGPPPPGLDAEWFFPADVRGMPDALVLPAPAPGGLPGLSAVVLAQQAADYAARVGLGPGGRLHTQLPPDDSTGVLALVGAPLAARAAVVIGPAAGEDVTAEAV